MKGIRVVLKLRRGACLLLAKLPTRTVLIKRSEDLGNIAYRALEAEGVEDDTKLYWKGRKGSGREG